MAEKMAKSSTKSGSSGSENSPRPPRNAGSSGGETSFRPPRNLFQKSGNEKVYDLTVTKKACVIRVDVPGCPNSNLSLAVVPDLNNVIFSAVEPAKPDYNYVGRKYEGLLVFPEGYEAKEATIKLVNGVIWIEIPKTPGTNVPIEYMHLHFKKPEATA